MSHPPPVRRPATRRVTRRAALRWGGRAMLGGVAGGACAARAPSTTGIGLPGPVLAPVDVSWDRIIRRVVGLRPYRPAGFRLAAARMGDQVVVHNYGHGGGGISLSWGTAELAAREAEAAAIGQARRAAVGCSSLVRGPQRTGGLSSMSLAYHDFDTLIGTLRVVGDDGGIERIDLPNAAACDPDPGWRERRRSLPGPLGEAKRQLREYFGGERRDFDLPLSPAGTAFQRRVWDELRRIPYGETVSYGELARRIGRPTASRAVGAANGRNPLAIVVPCHRVIGADGTLTGYGGGLPVKETLLAHERRVTGVAR